MALHNSVVLDLSGLKTGSLAEAGLAIAHVQMCRSRGRRVIAVVGASPERAARDLAGANRLPPTAEASERASVIASGPIEAAATFAEVLRDAGIDAVTAEPELWPATRGHALDAEPRRVSANALALALSEAEVVVIPGGVGRDGDGNTTSFGGDTAPLTAAFLGDRLALPVDRAGTERPDGSPDTPGVGSRKADRFIERSGVRVRPVRISPDASPIGAVRVAAFGEGAVGGLVGSWGASLEGGYAYERFEATEAGANALREARPDIILDFSNGADASYDLASWALRTGRTVITTNTAMLCERGGGLAVAALIGGGVLRASGAISGCPALAPVLDKFAVWPGVRRVQGSFSPLGDRVLDLRSEGVPADEAERIAASELGLDEEAVTLARTGADALGTLGAVAQLAFGTGAGVRANPRGPAHVSDLDLARAKAQGRRYRVIATAERIGEQVALRVGPVPLRSDDPLIGAEVGSVEAVVETRTGETAQASGRLQHPGSVAAAVLRDLIEVGRVPSPAQRVVPGRTGADSALGVTA